MEAGHEIHGTVDTYVVEGTVGEGGFGVTYRARRVSNGELVALKQLRLDKLDSWKALELFEREAKVLGALDHPRIPRYVEFFATTPTGPVAHAEGGDNPPDSLVLVQHLVQGVDLQKRLAAGETFDITAISAILRDALQALAYLHERNPPIVHRDVNPKNLVRDADGHTFLVDFGAIQHKLHEETVGGSTSVGTLGYLPMEQTLGKARPASDIYSLGVAVVVLMTGMQPESLPLDEHTGKIDLRRLGLVPAPADPTERRRVLAFLDGALEPAVGKRLGTARAALEVLDGRDALVPRPPTQLEPARPTGARTIFLLCLGGSLGSAAILYPLGFDNFSETELVRMAPFWVLPAAFGAIGLFVQHTSKPIANAVFGTIVAAFALAVFLFGIFPSL